jgi:hypothetical protein
MRPRNTKTPHGAYDPCGVLRHEQDWLPWVLPEWVGKHPTGIVGTARGPRLAALSFIGRSGYQHRQICGGKELFAQASNASSWRRWRRGLRSGRGGTADSLPKQVLPTLAGKSPPWHIDVWKGISWREEWLEVPAMGEFENQTLCDICSRFNVATYHGRGGSWKPTTME